LQSKDAELFRGGSFLQVRLVVEIDVEGREQVHAAPLDDRLGLGVVQNGQGRFEGGEWRVGSDAATLGGGLVQAAEGDGEQI
jgi:hypothetical protein